MTSSGLGGRNLAGNRKHIRGRIQVTGSEHSTKVDALTFCPGMSPGATGDILTAGVFDDAAMVDLDFLNDPDWMESITNSIS